MNVKLKITKTPEGKQESEQEETHKTNYYEPKFYVYDYTLYGDVATVSGHRSIENAQYQQFKETITYIMEYISTYLAQLGRDPRRATETYRSDIMHWLRGISRMVRKEFLPKPGTNFAKGMADLEQRAGSGEDIILTILTNDYLVPWWLANPYISDEPADREKWNSLFSIGLIPTLADSEETEARNIQRPRIALISRPTEDLREATNIAERLRKRGLARAVGGGIDIRNGAENEDPARLGRFGLLREELVESFGKGDILLYYGHFKLDERCPGDSRLETIFEYDVGRALVPHDEITLDSIKHLLQGKVVFLDACRSVGLPLLSDDPFPPKEETLPNFYMANGITCVGTLYPIFDDAAVDYAMLFIQSLLQGHCLGKALRDACRGLMTIDRYTLFDWSPYVLVGDPSLRVQLQEE